MGATVSGPGGKANAVPSLQALRGRIAIDPSSPSGLVWVVAPRRGSLPGAAGFRSGRYWRVQIDGRTYQAHRLVWALTHGECPCDVEIDHIDGDRSHNAIGNLRLATKPANGRNRMPNRGCSSACKGVSRVAVRGSRGKGWRASCFLSGRHTNLGSFHTEREAAHAYNIAALERDDEFARINDLDAPGETIPATALTDEIRTRLGLADRRAAGEESVA